jgi:trigger factor
VLEVGEAEVDKTLKVLRDQRKTFAAADRPAANGDRVLVDFTGRMNGEVFKGGQATDFAVMLGAGRMLPDFEKAIEGMAAGQSKTFEMTFPDDYQAAELAGKPVNFEVAVKSVEGAVLPEVDAEFAKSLGVEDGDLARMRVEIRSNLEREVKKRLQAKIKQQAMNALVEANPIEVPKSLIERESASMVEAARQDLANRGVDIKDVPVETSWFAEESVRRVKLGLIVSEVVKAHGLHATPEQLRVAVDEFAQTYEDPAEVVRWYYSHNERLEQLEVAVIEENVVQWVLKSAQVRDVPISFDELMGNAA